MGDRVRRDIGRQGKPSQRRHQPGGASCIAARYPRPALAIGGGSAMDAAKAISLLLTHEGRIEDYEGSFTLRHAIPPIVAIPTTAGTGSEVTCFSVITDTARHFKMSVQDYRWAPFWHCSTPAFSTRCLHRLPPQPAWMPSPTPSKPTPAVCRIPDQRRAGAACHPPDQPIPQARRTGAGQPACTRANAGGQPDRRHGLR
ncbi:iron-containing alcohol dehydrogenase [Pseudomonas aeruginosa]